ncbi:54S ribosomal protein L4 mitochondrial, partial [Serendipita sp. 401]
MFRPALRRAFPCRTRSFTSVKRCLATHASEQPSLQPGSFDDTVEENKPAASKNDENTALRSNLKIPVKPDHGLFHFFRRIKDEDTQKGYRYVNVEPTNDRIHTSSRAWTTAELRRKSFRDLHILWYMCQRERNLLATQKAEVRRLHHLASVVSTPITLRARM